MSYGDEQSTQLIDGVSVVIRADPQLKIASGLADGWSSAGMVSLSAVLPVAPVLHEISGELESAAGSRAGARKALVWSAKAYSSISHAALERPRAGLAERAVRSYEPSRGCKMPGMVPEATNLASLEEALGRNSLARCLEVDDAMCLQGAEHFAADELAGHPGSYFFFEQEVQNDGGRHLEQKSFMHFKRHLDAVKQRHKDSGLYHRITGHDRDTKPSDLPDTVRGSSLLVITGYLVGQLRDYVPSKHTDNAGCGRAIQSIVDPSSDNELAAFFGAIDLSWLRKCRDTKGVAAPRSIGAPGEPAPSAEDAGADYMDDSRMGVREPLGREPTADDFEVPLALMRAFMLRF